ncbi:MAG: hypothetical protein NT145_08295 [Elusimicrobia bacterium]|nr:hypothetical protein [Elusimicrobiota bacterium]
MDFKRSNEISYIKPPLDMFLGEYNKMLASILVENINNFAYIASPVINRMEAQTHFFEKIEKYIQIREMLLKDNLFRVLLTGEDVFLYDELKREFKGRVKKKERPPRNFRDILKGVLKHFFPNIYLKRKFKKNKGEFLKSTRELIRASEKMPSCKKEYTSIIRTYFDFRCTDQNGKLREEYFGPFAVDLAKHENVLVIYKLLNPKGLASFEKLCRDQHDFDSCLIEKFLTVNLLSEVIQLYESSKIKLRNKYYYRDNDITSMLQKMIDMEFSGLHGIDVFVEREIARKVFGLKPERIYMPYENQTWEKVYPFVKNDEFRASHTRIIGFQHTGLSYKLLQHFPAEIEKNLHLFPDKLLTVGKIYQLLLKEKAYYPCEIVEGAALRHSKYVVDGVFNVKEPHKELFGKIAYAFSYDTSKYERIINVLLEIFKNSNICIYLKMHPDYDEDDIMKTLNIKIPDNFILAQKIPWTTIYDNSDCIIYDDNSIGIEGMINGVRTYMLDFGEPIYECGRMFYFDEWNTAINIEDLKVLKQSIESKVFNPWYDIDKMKKYLNLYYNAYSKERYFSSYF